MTYTIADRIVDWVFDTRPKIAKFFFWDEFQDEILADLYVNYLSGLYDDPEYNGHVEYNNGGEVEVTVRDILIDGELWTAYFYVYLEDYWKETFSYKCRITNGTFNFVGAPDPYLRNNSYERLREHLERDVAIAVDIYQGRRRLFE